MKVSASVIINAPIEQVWAAVRCFDAVANWNPGVTAATMESGSPTAVGSVRKLNIVDGSVFRETLLAHSDLEYYYSYDIIESPLPCRNYIATHRFIEITDGNKTLGIWQGEFDCDTEHEKDLRTIIGEQIYRDGQRGLNSYLQEKNQ